MIIGNREFDLGSETYIMGILNATPDSFYCGGRFGTVEKALAQAEKMVAEGADIIDIGGMSTRPGHSIVSQEEETQRVVPIVREIRKRFAVPLSVDTYRSKVAEEALNAGADMVNDVWGFMRGEGEMADTVAKYGVPCCLAHNSDTVASSVDEVLAGLSRCIEHARSHGVSKSKIIVDPGIGFAKEPLVNLCIIKELRRFAELKHPILLGASRKSVIGNALGLPVGERLEGTLAVTAYVALSARVAFLRVHDVKENARVLNMLKAIKNA
ncbi:MAG: dihydropteroate synthase [Clostridiales bacterium]|nr:dihydropteroate synthase [Clostridiales bacterium]